MENGSLVEDSHAKILVSLGKGQELPVKGLVFGLNIGGLFATYDRDSQSWKTLELSLFGGLIEYAEAFPRSGIMLNGRIYEQRTWVHRTEEKESGLWRTPDTGSGRARTKAEMDSIFNGNPKKKQMRLQDQVKDIRFWPTPTSRDYKDNASEGALKRRSPGLGALAQKFPTPTAQDFKRRGPNSRQQGLPEKIYQETGGSLNPRWVEWLQGYPIEWTDLEDSEIVLSLK